MSLRIADYDIIEPWPQPDGDEIYVAAPPARLGLDRPTVALKVMRGVRDARGVQRAVDELRVFAAVDSPYLVRVLDAGQEGDVIFYAMDQPPLGTLADPAPEATPARRVRAVADAARGTHALHEAGVVHRNIAPSRVLLDEDKGRLADLSLARFTSPGLVMSTMPTVDHLEYLDPALLLGSGASRATDIWSLAAVLHFVLSGGQTLYPELPAGNPLGAVRRVLSRSFRVADGLPDDAQALLAICLSPHPEERPATAEDLADDIERLAVAQ